MVPFEDHEKYRSQYDQKTGGEDYDPCIEAPSSFYRKGETFCVSRKRYPSVPESDTSQDGQHSDDDLEHVGIAAEIIEQVPLEERKTCIIEGRDGMENRVVGFLVNIQKRCRIAPVEKNEYSSDGFDYQCAMKISLSRKILSLKLRASSESLISAWLLIRCCVWPGSGKTWQRSGCPIPELYQQHDDDLSAKGKCRSDVHRGKPGYATGRGGGKQCVDERYFCPFGTHLREHQQGSTCQDEQQKRQHEQFLGGRGA